MSNQSYYLCYLKPISPLTIREQANSPWPKDPNAPKRINRRNPWSNGRRHLNNTNFGVPSRRWGGNRREG